MASRDRIAPDAMKGKERRHFIFASTRSRILSKTKRSQFMLLSFCSLASARSSSRRSDGAVLISHLTKSIEYPPAPFGLNWKLRRSAGSAASSVEMARADQGTGPTCLC